MRVLLVIAFLLSVINTYPQDKGKISLDVKNTSIREILKQVESGFEYSFVYNETIDLEKKKTLKVKDGKINDVLNLIFKDTNISWKISKKHIILKNSKTKSSKVTISGYVLDIASSETLIGATVSDIGTSLGGITNAYGYFTIQVPVGQTDLRVSYIGYDAIKQTLNLQNDTIINFKLKQGLTLHEIVVTNKEKFLPSSSSIELSQTQIKSMPAVLGEHDVLKSLQYIPGVQSGAEGTAGMYVRGGGMDQNLYLLDGVPIYNAGHFYGIVSIFNGDAVKKVSFHKGSFPARFGGRLSSVVDIRLKDGDMQNYHGALSVGLLASRLNFEGPIIKNKTSFNLSVRRSYVDLFMRAGKLFTDDPIPVLYMYDLNMKLNHKFTDKSRLYFSLYNGKDKQGVNSKKKEASFYNKTEIDYKWGNTVASMRWNYIFNNKLFVNTTAAYNLYNFKFKSSETLKEKTLNSYYENYQKSEIKDLSISTDFEYTPHHQHQIKFGSGFTFHRFNPEIHGSKIKEVENGEETIGKTNHFLNNRIIGREALIYLEDEFAITSQLKANLGLHFSLFDVQGKTYTSLQPRISVGYQFNDKISVKSSFTKMNQYINLLTSNSLSQPTDLWVPITERLKPMEARQYTLGTYYELGNAYNFSIEGFYKQMKNVLEYKDGASWKDNYNSWEDLVESGKGSSYGVEVFVQKNFRRITGFAGYTLAWNNRTFPTINMGKRFDAKYDQRHNITLTASYKLTEKLDLSASWMYATGNNATLAMEEFQALPDVNASNGQITNPLPSLEQIDKRNNYRLPATHHLDFNLDYHHSAKSMWSFTLYNVYNRANPFMVQPGYSEKDGQVGKYKLIQYSIFRFVPSVSYTLKF